MVNELDDYEYSLDPSNLYFDINNRIKVLRRDVRNETENTVSEKDSEETVTNKVRALIVSALQDKYSYADILEGGEDLVSREETFLKLFECETLDEIRSYVKAGYEEKDSLKIG